MVIADVIPLKTWPMNAEEKYEYRLFEVASNNPDPSKDDDAVLVAASTPESAIKAAAENCIDQPWAVFEIGVVTGAVPRELPFLVRGPYHCVAINRMGWHNWLEDDQLNETPDVAG